MGLTVYVARAGRGVLVDNASKRRAVDMRRRDVNKSPDTGLSGGINQIPGADNIDPFGLGRVIGALLGAAPMPGLGVLIGLAMYLPFSITFGYGLGCLASMWMTKKHGIEFYQHKLVPVAAGLIVGEAIMGIFHAAYEMVKAMGA